MHVRIPACDGAAVHSKGGRVETVSVKNHRGVSRHPEYANHAERVRSERVGVGGGLDGKYDGAETNL